MSAHGNETPGDDAPPTGPALEAAVRQAIADTPDRRGGTEATVIAKLQALQGAPPAQQFSTIADLGGLKQYASMRGVPRAKADQCLANQAEIDQLVQMTSDAVSTYPGFQGTPSFVINGQLVEQTATWDLLEPKIKEALAS